MAVAAMRRAGIALLVACGLVATTTDLNTTVATVVILLSVLVHAAGELWHNAGSFGLRYELAPDHAQGEYQGVFIIGTAGAGGADARALSPLLLSYLCVGLGQTGWIIVGLVLLAAGLAASVVTRIAALPSAYATAP